MFDRGMSSFYRHPLLALWTLVWASLVKQSRAIDAFSTQGCFPESSLSSDLTLNNVYIYQSGGYCREQCPGKKIAATLNGNMCYCGDVAPDPSLSVDLSNCDVNCSGYPSEKCGGSGYFLVYNNVAVIALTLSLSASTSTSSLQASSSSRSSSSSGASSSTTSSSSSSSSSSASSRSSSSPASTSSPKSSASSSSSASASPSTLGLSSSTVGRSTSRTVSSQTLDASASSTVPVPQSKSLSTGGMVGAIVGLVGGALVIALIAMFFLCYRPRRKEKQSDEVNNDEYNDEFTLLGPLNEKANDSMSIEPNPFLLAGGYNNFDTLQQKDSVRHPLINHSPYAAQDSFTTALNVLNGHSRLNSHMFNYSAGTAATAGGMVSSPGHESQPSDGSGLVDRSSIGDRGDQNKQPHPFTQLFHPGQQSVPENAELYPPQQGRRKLSTGSLPDMIARQPGSLKVVNN